MEEKEKKDTPAKTQNKPLSTLALQSQMKKDVAQINKRIDDALSSIPNEDKLRKAILHDIITAMNNDCRQVEIRFTACKAFEVNDKFTGETHKYPVYKCVLSKGDPQSIGDDIILQEEAVIPPGRSIIFTNICMNLPFGVEAKIESRSCWSSRGLWGTHDVLTAPQGSYWERLFAPAIETPTQEYTDVDILSGKVDPGYPYPIGVIVNNHTDGNVVIDAGTKLAQITLYQTIQSGYKKVDAFTEMQNRGGGWGSSN